MREKHCSGKKNKLISTDYKVMRTGHMRESLVQLGLKGLHSLQAIHVRKNRHVEESLEALDLLLVLPLPMPPLYLHLLLLLMSSQFIWTVTMSLYTRMILIYFSGGVTTN